MGKKSRKRPDRKKKDAAAAPAAAAGKQPDQAASQADIEELLRAAAAKEPGAEERWRKYAESLPRDRLERAMKAGRDSATEKRGLKAFVSPILRCAECQTDHFSQPAHLCLFCPECPNATCGDCGDTVRALTSFMVCPKCRVMVCFDHAMRLMEDNGTQDGCLAMSCRDCGETKRLAVASWARAKAQSSTRQTASVAEASVAEPPAPAPSAPAAAPRKRRVCDVCGKRGKFVCDACGVRRYCSEACQTADWQWHKSSCMGFLQMKSVGAALGEIVV
jgi:hypothetical protein